MNYQDKSTLLGDAYVFQAWFVTKSSLQNIFFKCKNIENVQDNISCSCWILIIVHPGRALWNILSCF